MSAPAYNPDTATAHSRLASARRTLERFEAGLAPITGWSYRNAADEAHIAYQHYRAAGMDIEAAKAWKLHQQLERLASL